MSERIRPFPQTPRFPGEPRLSGSPRSARDSMFLSTPGLGDVIELIVDVRGMNSDRRNSFFKKYLDSSPTVVHNQLTDVLNNVANGVFTDSEALKREATAVSERLIPETDRVQRPVFNSETLDALANTEMFVSHMVKFSEYLNTPQEDANRFVAGYARSLFSNPDRILEQTILEKLVDESSAEDPGNQTGEVNAFHGYNQKLKQALESLSVRPENAALDSASLVHWMNLLCVDSEYSSVAEKILYNWLNVQDLDLVLERVHQLATAAYTSDIERIQRKMIDITGYRTSVMPIDSPAAIRFDASLLRISHDSWRKRREINDAEMAIFPWLGVKNRLQYKRQVSSRAYRKFVGQWGKKLVADKGKEEMDKSISTVFREVTIGFWRRYRAQKDVAALEGDPIISDSALRRWITEKTSKRYATKKLPRSRKVSGEIQLPGISRSIYAPLPQVVSEVSRVLLQIPGQKLERSEHWRTLALLVPPDLDQKKLDELNRATATMRREIKGARLRGFSKRGDRIFVTSPRLLQLGFNTLEILPQPNGYELKIDVGGKVFVDKLDSDLQLLDSRFGSTLRLPITGAFLSHIIVCHAHELLCRDFGDDEANGRISESRRQFYSRRDHRRILPEGEKPTKNQIVKALVDYDVDLVSRNKERVESGATRLMTWVSLVDRIDMAGTGAVESHAIDATSLLDKIFSD